MAAVLLVDDPQLVREGIKQLLEDNCTVCGEASNGREAIQKVLELKPDVVLMDVSMPEMNGIEATRQIRREAPTTKVILLSMHDSPQVIKLVKEAGADAYVPKAGSTEYLRETIKSVLETQTCLRA